jgi:hypothetical protein
VLKSFIPFSLELSKIDHNVRLQFRGFEKEYGTDNQNPWDVFRRFLEEIPEAG